MPDNLVVVETMALRSYVPAEGPVEDKLLAAMRAIQQGRGMGWVTEETQQFGVAVSAVFSLLPEDDPDRGRITREIDEIAKLSALFQAAQAGLTVKVPDVGEDWDRIGLLGLWRQAARLPDGEAEGEE